MTMAQAFREWLRQTAVAEGVGNEVTDPVNNSEVIGEFTVARCVSSADMNSELLYIIFADDSKVRVLVDLSTVSALGL